MTDAGTHVPLLWSSAGQTGKNDIHDAIGLKDVFNSFLYEAQAGPSKDRWHLTESPEESLSITEAEWYDNFGKTAKLYKKNQFAFNTEKEKYVYRSDRWYETPLFNSSTDYDLNPSPVADPVREVSMTPSKREKLIEAWNRFVIFEKKIPCY